MAQLFDYTAPPTLVASPSRSLRRFSKFVAASTLILIFMGSLVTSTGTGLSVPDWPNTYGYFMFAFPLKDMVGGIFYEHSHRMAASIVGFLTLVMAFWVGKVEPRRWVRYLAFAALATVIFQGILGGVTVLFFLPTPVSVFHAVLAQSFFVITVILAYSQSKERYFRVKDKNDKGYPTISKWALAVAGCIFIQLILGALMRHTASGLAVPDFPTMAGQMVPAFNEGMLSWINSWRFDADFEPVYWHQVWIHLIHRAWAVVVVAMVVGLFIKTFKHRGEKIFQTALGILALVAVQFSLGAFTVLSGKQVSVTSLHVVCGAALLGMVVLMVLRCSPVARQA